MSDINFDNYSLGAEIEFYLLDNAGQPIADMESGKFPVKKYQVLPQFAEAVAGFKLELSEYRVEDESGAGQFEADFGPTASAEELVHQISEFKYSAKTAAEHHGLKIDFSAKPIVAQPGNGLHIHYCNEVFDPFSLQQNGGVMPMQLSPNNDYVIWAIGGLLLLAPEAKNLFYTNIDDMRRFLPWYNAPTKLCWGGNNRSVAIRVPDSRPKRIEHRIACADVDPLPLLHHVIDAARYGMENRIIPSEKVYGNAWEDQYNYPQIFG